MHNKKAKCHYQVGFTGLMNMDRLDLARWCRDNCKGDYYYLYTDLTFYFENAKDAVRFKEHRDKVYAWMVLAG